MTLEEAIKTLEEWKTCFYNKEDAYNKLYQEYRQLLLKTSDKDIIISSLVKRINDLEKVKP